MINEAGIWKSTDIWKFRTSDHSSGVYIENTTRDSVLSATSEGSLHFVDAAATPSFKKGNTDDEGYFTLTCLKSQKVLTATSDESLEMKGRVDCKHILRIIFYISFTFRS